MIGVRVDRDRWMDEEWGSTCKRRRRTLTPSEIVRQGQVEKRWTRSVERVWRPLDLTENTDVLSSEMATHQTQSSLIVSEVKCVGACVHATAGNSVLNELN